MDQFDDEYLIGDVAKMFNISAGTVRHYEKIGLIQSAKEDVNNYRRYNLSILDQLRHIILLRSLELSLDDISDIQNHFEKDIDHALHILRGNQEKTEQKIAYFEKVKDKTSSLIREFEKCKANAGSIEVKPSPAIHFQSLNSTLDLQDLTKSFHTVLHKSSSLPKSAFLIQKDRLLERNIDSEAYIQFGVFVDSDEKAGKGKVAIPSRNSVYSMYAGSLADMRNKYREMMEWMEERGFRPADDALEICNFSIGNHYIFEIYIPLEQAYETGRDAKAK